LNIKTNDDLLRISYKPAEELIIYMVRVAMILL